MAVVLQFDLCVTNSCTQLNFTEETGYYNSSNLTGYGTPNIETSDVLTAVLEITGPSGITYIIDLFDTGLFPSNDINLSYTIPLDEIGTPTSIVDGQWYFTYTITTNTETYTKSLYKYFYCNSECCVDNLLALVDLCDCCKNNVTMDNYIKASTFLEALKNAAICGDVTNFTSIKKIIDKICLNSGCKTCK